MTSNILVGRFVPGVPRFSVVIICYNSEPFLLEAIESTLSQDMDEVEVIVVDDGSINPVSKVLPSRLLERCTILIKENGGIAAARNSGIRIARSPFVALLDGDDCMLSHHCSMSLKMFDLNPEIDVLVPESYVIEAGVPRLTKKHSLRYPRLKPINFKNYFEGQCPLAGGSTFRRECFDKHCYLDEEFRNGGEDLHHFALLLAGGVKFMYLPETSYEYRRHSGSITYSQPIHFEKCILRAVDKLLCEPIFSPEMRTILLDFRERTMHSLAWNSYRQCFMNRDFNGAAKWIPMVQKRLLDKNSSKLKFWITGAVTKIFARKKMPALE